MKRQTKLTLRNLISNGYFPAELIPPFNTKDFGKHVNSIVSSTVGMNIQINGDKILSSKCCIHSIPRILHHRRSLGIPNPFHQLKLAQTIVDNWKDIKKHVYKSKYSLTLPVVKSGSPRAISRSHDFRDIPSIIPMLSTNSRYVLRTDISRYYPTIYTHSIPWACHGKAFAKIKSNRGHNYYGNALDTHVRNTQDQQTIGIPIGPDSSLIISELIGSTMDMEIYTEIGAKGIRYIDDYYFFFNTTSEAEEALTKLHKIAKKYELELNPEKTSIYSLPDSLEHKWTSEIRGYEFHKSLKRQKTDLVTFFSKAFEYSKSYPNEYVLKYSLSRIKNELIDKNNWDLYESLILNSIIAEPSVLPTATEIFLAYYNLGYNLNLKKIGETINNIIGHHSKLGHGYEVSWGLWLAKTLGIKISKASAKELSQVEDSIVAITALDLRNTGLITSGLDLSEWMNYLTHENLYQDKWLFAYEACKKGWVTPSNNYISIDPFFSILEAKNIEFYNPMLQVVAASPENDSNTHVVNTVEQGFRYVIAGGY
ncbi:reverse transcriptase domain-containing protein [Brevibacillus sp. GCM10020057]|uniref:reverse transcriptase domain-containing protein n=1 Tax=Brevibacillus sp. GCM10020057 TaxID=3317327 RepID=UPI0036381F1B